MEHSTEVFVGIDVPKLRNAIAAADGERGGEVRYLGEVDASEEAMRRFVKQLASRHERLHFLLRGRTDRLWSPSPHHRARSSLHGGRTVAGSQKARRPR